MKFPTIKDVAALAGVSSATVSHVINNTRCVSDGVRGRVNSAIKELGFTPNVMARNFKIGKRNIIGFIVPDISNIFFATIIEEVEMVLSKKGYNLIIANTKETRRRELELIRTLATGVVGGFIIASTVGNYDEIASILPENFPQVFFDRSVKNCSADQVLVSCEIAMREGVRELIRAGHTRIGYIAGLRRLSTTTERLNAFRRELTENALAPDDSLVRYADSMAQSAYTCAMELLGSGCTALVASNNVMTMDAMNAIQQYSKETGKTYELLGYSYGEWNSWLPNLKTIVQPAREMGRKVGIQILHRIKDPSAPIEEIIIPSVYTGGSDISGMGYGDRTGT